MNELTRINKILIFVLLIVVFLYYGAPFLIPFVFGVFFAFLMVPLCRFLEKIGINRIISSLLSTLVVLFIFGGTLLIFITQVNSFASDMPDLEEKVESLVESTQNGIESITGLTLSEQSEIMDEWSGEIIEKIEPFVTNFFGKVFSTTFSFLLVLIYVFLLLLYREKIFDFVMMYVDDNEEDTAQKTISRISKVAFHYLWGRVQVMLILGVLFYITFLLFGLPYALLFALFGAVITIIPYIGPLLSGVLPVLFSFVYFDSTQKIVFFAAVVLVIQLVESYVLEPLILGKEVKLNPMVVIVSIVMGGIVWGLAGMILFVPIFAIIKIISIGHSGLKPIGFLFGHENKQAFES